MLAAAGHSGLEPESRNRGVLDSRFRGNDKAHRRSSRTLKITRLAAKAEKMPNDDR